MALFLSPIREKVQQELNKRSNRYKKDGNELVHEKHGDNVERGGVYSRSTWIRIVPNTRLVKKQEPDKILPRPILCGGILYEKEGSANAGEPVKTGGMGAGIDLGDNLLYSQRGSGTSDDKHANAGAGYRPKPGVTSVDVKTKGDLGSLTEIIIKWNCF